MKEKDEIIVVKVGGGVVEDSESLQNLLNDFSQLPGRKVLIHGGGRSATRIAAALGVESKMVDGRRVTDEEMLRIVTMVYGGLVNKTVVAGLQAQGVNAFLDLGLQAWFSSLQSPCGYWPWYGLRRHYLGCDIVFTLYK